MKTICLDGESLTIEDVVGVAKSWVAPEGIHVKIAAEAQEKIQRARRAVEEFIERGEIIYGVTTGFGAYSGRLVLGQVVRKPSWPSDHLTPRP